jgi:hypothetical protein
MARTIIDHVFEVRFECDRCRRVNSRETDGDLNVPAGWSFLHVSEYSNQREGTLLCPTCLAYVLAAAAPAILNVDKCPAGHGGIAPGAWCGKCGERIPHV